MSHSYMGLYKAIFMVVVLYAMSHLVSCMSCMAHAESEKPVGRQEVSPDPQTLQSAFVSFSPNMPLRPGVLDLTGYETRGRATSAPVLSPDKTQMAVTEVFYLPSNRQTFSRVYLMPVGRSPSQEEMLTPEAREAMAKEREKHPDTPPKVQLNQVDPHAFWDQYNPDKQIKTRQTVYEAGFDRYAPYRSEIVQVLDWSRYGDYLLMSYRPGIHHVGLYKTIPVVYNLHTRELVRYTFLPETIWQALLTQNPELATTPERTHDIRPLGWHVSSPAAIIAKVVMFEGQSEVSAGFYSYDIQSGALSFLGDTISPTLIAQNGWLVNRIDPTASGGPKTYGPGEAPPTQEEWQSQHSPAKPPRRSRWWH